MPEQLRLELRPSRLLGVLLLGSHAAALVCPWLTTLGAVYCLMLNALVLGSAAWQLRYYLGGHPRQVIRIEYAAARWLLHERHTVRQAQLARSNFVTPFLTVLRLRVDGERHCRVFPLFPDSAPPDQRRRLRMLLLSGGG